MLHFMQMKWAQKQTGFTIVELLIVVAVIAILASVTVVGFSGIQARSVNTARIAAARNAYQLVQAYAATNGGYPAIPENTVNPSYNGACIGTGWPTLQGQPVCWNIFTDGGERGVSTYLEIDSVNDALRTVGTLPSFPVENVYEGFYNAAGVERPLVVRGLILMHRTSTGSGVYPAGYSIAYTIRGTLDDADCGLPGAIKYGAAEGRHAGFVSCIVPLPALE